MQNSPKISVILPTYNGGKYIQEALESMLWQSFRDFEVLVIDDASTDNTVELVKNFRDARIVLFQNPKNLGLIGTLNHGITLAKGDYIARMDQDDVAVATRFEKQVRFLDEHPSIGLCGTWFRFMGTEDVVAWPAHHEDIRAQMVFNTAIGHPTVMMRSSVIKGLGLAYDPSFSHAEDYEFWTRISGVAKVANLPEILLEYRAHSEQTSVKYRAGQDQSTNRIRRSMLQTIAIEPSDEELETHISLWDRLPSQIDLKKAEAWIEKLKIATERNPTEFSNALRRLLEKLSQKLDPPLVSVIVASYNHAHLIGQTLESLSEQTHRQWECIVIDDGSTDDTREVLKKKMDADPRIRYFYQKNSGPIVARNFALTEAKGSIIQFLDSDDLLEPTKIEDQVAALARDQAVDIVYGDYLCFSHDDPSHTWTYSRVRLQADPLEDFAKNWEKDLSIPIHCFLFRKSCFDRWGGFSEKNRLSHEDWGLYLKFAGTGAQFKYCHSGRALYRVKINVVSRGRDESRTRRGKKALYREQIFGLNTPFKVRLILTERFLRDVLGPWKAKFYRGLTRLKQKFFS